MNFRYALMGSAACILTFVWLGCRRSRCENPRDDFFGNEFYTTCEPGATLYKFLGTFSAIELCSGSQNAYELRIGQPDTVNYRVVIQNIYDTDGSYPLTAEINRNQITIPEQEVNGVVFSGGGAVSGNSLSLFYRLRNQILADSCSCNAAKL